MFKDALVKAVWQQSRGWLIGVLLFILSYAALSLYQSFYVVPETGQLAARNAELQELLNKRQANISKSGVSLSAVEQMETDLHKFSELIPGKQNFSDFVGELFSWAQKNKLNIRQVSYRPEIDKETEYLNYGLSFSVQGTYSQLKKFIYDMETSRRIMVIDSISLAGTQVEASGVSLRINLTTYFREVAQ